MDIHIGDKIKKKAKELRIGPTELAGLINTSKQNVTGIYKRKSVDSEMLQKISKALDFDFFKCYQPGDSGNKSKLIEKLSVENKNLKGQVSTLKKQLNDKEIAYLKRINKLLETLKSKGV